MEKYICPVCNQELGTFTVKTFIGDGAVCQKCLFGSGITKFNNPKAYTDATIVELCAKKTSFRKLFKYTKSVGEYIKIDEQNKIFKLERDFFDYSNLLSFELLENGEVITKGGLGRAVVGGLLLNGVGAIVGAVTGGKKSSGICMSMKIRLTLKNTNYDTVYIDLIAKKTKKKSRKYKNAQSDAQECISALEIITDINQTEQQNLVTERSSTSVADEIAKFKNLLDTGAISELEFKTKKKQLLMNV